MVKQAIARKSTKHRDDPAIGSLELLEKIVLQMQKRMDVDLHQYGIIETSTATFPLYKFQSTSLEQQTKNQQAINQQTIVITTGFHGDEIAGPLTMMNYANLIFRKAHEAGLSVILYPLINPSGFDQRTRYNNPFTFIANNDFMRYRKEGKLVGDLGSSSEPYPWLWSDESEAQTESDKKLPLETKYLIKDLKQLSWENIVCFLDFHQDLYLDAHSGLFTYAYYMGDVNQYISIMEKASKIVPLLINTPIEEGHGVEINLQSNLKLQAINEIIPKTDQHGLILRHDGSITDLAYKNGVPFSAAIETTAFIPLPIVYRINLLWINECINYAKESILK